MKIIDAYAHVSLPRFLSAEEMLQIMERYNVEQSILATADTCPDLSELSRAQIAFPRQFRSVGMPVGRDIQDIAANIESQLRSGFIGIRFMDSMLMEHPQLLDLMARMNGIPFVVGSRVLTEAAPPLLAFLNQHPQCQIVAPHFAGAPDAKALSANSPAQALLRHPRFLIIFCRQGAYPQPAVRDWARHLIGEIGWPRILFGSEYPVCVWRNESFDDVIRWIDDAGLSPGAADREAFFHGNAARTLFAPRFTPPAPLIDQHWIDFRRPAPVWYFPQSTLDVDEQTNRRLIAAWHQNGGNSSFRDFLAGVLRKASENLSQTIQKEGPP